MGQGIVHPFRMDFDFVGLKFWGQLFFSRDEDPGMF